METKMKMMAAALLLVVSMVKAQQPQPPAGGKPQGPPHSPAEHSKMVAAKLEKDLLLNQEQANKVAAAYEAFFKSMEQVKGKPMPPPPPPPPLSPEQKKKADSLSAIRDALIKKALTEGQFTKYKQIEKTLRPPRPQGPPPTPAPKQ